MVSTIAMWQSQFNISCLFAHSLFYLIHRYDPIRYYHTRSEWTREQRQRRGTLHSLNLQGWILVIKLFNVISRTLVGGWVLPLCKDAVSVFYYPGCLGYMINEKLAKRISKFWDKSKFLWFFCNVRHSLAVLTHWVGFCGLEHSLGIHGFMPTSPCSILEILATRTKFLEPSGYCRVIHSSFNFCTTNIFGWFHIIIYQFELIKC